MGQHIGEYQIFRRGQSPRVEALEDRTLLSLAGNQLFPSDSPWNHSITDAPVAANSATLVSSIGASKPLHPDFGTTYGGLLNGIPYNVVSGSPTGVNVVIDAYPAESDQVPVPIPANAVIEGDPPAGVAAFDQPPSFVQVSLANQYATCWDPQSSAVQALQDPTTAGNRFASTWYSSSDFTVDLDFTDGQAHRVAFYMVDFDSMGRTQTVDVINPATSAILAEQKVANFSGGEYLVFDLTGNVELKFTNTNSSSNAVLSGIFFGAPSSPAIGASSAPGASFVSADTTTQGNWQGVYGGSGYDMPFPQGEGDRHLIVYNSTTNVGYELFNVHRPSEEADGQWHADSEAVWDFSKDSFRPAGWTSADAAGLPILTGLVRPDETLTQGVINHALRFTVPSSDDAYVFPASHEAGSNNAALPRMGERFRLESSFNISSFPAADQVILQALKTYGMIVADNGSSWYISGSPSDQWDDDTLHDLTQVIGSDFQAVNLTPIVSSLGQSSGAAGGGNTVTVNGVNFQGIAGQLSVSFGGVAATNVQVLSDNTLTATAPAQAAGTKVDVTITTPYGTSATSAADQYTYTAGLPPGVTASAGAAYSYNSTADTLSLTSGTLTFAQDLGSPAALNVSASGAGSALLFQTTQHLAGLTLAGGATATVASLGAARTHSNHSVLVIGTLGAAADPTFSIDSASRLDLQDNDLIIHTGSSDTAGHTELSNVQNLAAMGRKIAPGGNLFSKTVDPWSGNGLMSSTAAANDAYTGENAGYELNVLGVVDNSDLDLGSYRKWIVGSFSESLGKNDIIVKYTYNGDFTLEGAVSTDAATIFSADYAPGVTQSDFAFGDVNGDDFVDGTDATAFSGLLFGLGTGGAKGAQL